MEKYEPSIIEPKWRKTWEDKGMYKATDLDSRPKKYLLFEFPYPSGDRLHVGHARSYVALDTMARKYRMDGMNVLLPMGWDAFGLPAENYAIKNKVSPQKITLENISHAKEQAQSWGLSIDWDREINTTDPDYYKWTQWIFVQLFKKDMAYRTKTKVNWCPQCKTNLANEEVLADGTHERCGCATEQRDQEQWLIRITRYADRLIEDLKEVDFLDRISTQQINWIGRSEGINFKHKVKDMDVEFEVYDSIPQTFMAQTFVIIAPEHPMVTDLVKGTPHEKDVLEFVDKIKKKKATGKFDIEKDMEGIFTGRYSENYLGIGRDLPIWVASFALADYGTGIVGCSAHDERDFAFAKKYDIPLHPVLFPTDQKQAKKVENIEIFYREPDGILREPKEFNERRWDEVREDIIDYIEKNGLGKRTVNYKLRDWIFSRQRYWGEPIPIVHCEKCGYVAVPEDQLPVKLPELEHYEPSGTGESPLSKVTEWVNTTCPQCGGSAKRETDTMPNWAGSNWYFLAYTLGMQKLKVKNQNFGNEEFQKILKYWMPVDLYNGGMEHTTLHLLYSRFIYKFLFDIGVVPGKEPYKARRSHGMILGADRQKMSKSRGNVINPDDVIAKYGADTFRVYESFIGPFDQMISWSDESLAGCSRFLTRVWSLAQKKVSAETPVELKKRLHKTIKKVGSDIDEMKFNTAVAMMMEFINAWQTEGTLSREDAESFLKILSPFAPHIADELWEVLGNKESIHLSSWPKYDESLLKEENVSIVVQENGKHRGNIEVPFDSDESAVIEACKANDKLSALTEGVKKSIYVKNKLINFVR